MDREAMLPAVETFVAALREACAAGLEGEARWQRCRDLLSVLLADPELRRHARSWPVGGFDGKKVDNLLFYVDPDYGFALNGLIKNPGGRAMIHDHGPAWTVYGLLEGEDVVNTGRAMRALGATVERTGEGAWRVLGVGHVSLELNSLGSLESRRRYRGDLVAYLERRRAARDADPSWQDYLARTEGLVVSQENKLTRPTAWSGIR